MSAVYCHSPSHRYVFPAPGPLLKHFACQTWGKLFPDPSQDMIKLHLPPSIPKCIYTCFEFCLPSWVISKAESSGNWTQLSPRQ